MLDYLIHRTPMWDTLIVVKNVVLKIFNIIIRRGNRAITDINFSYSFAKIGAYYFTTIFVVYASSLHYAMILFSLKTK